MKRFQAECARLTREGTYRRQDILGDGTINPVKLVGYGLGAEEVGEFDQMIAAYNPQRWRRKAVPKGGQKKRKQATPVEVDEEDQNQENYQPQGTRSRPPRPQRNG